MVDGFRHWLLVYDRSGGELLRDEAYDDFHQAAAIYFDLERQHLHEVNTEVVMLSARSREDLLRTHSRYFLTVPMLLERLWQAVREGAA